MKRAIEVKHVRPRAQVQALLEALSDRLADKLRHFPDEAVTLRVVFDDNGRHSLHHIALTCHVPGHTAAAHEEGREAGAVIRAGFAELERQLDKTKATVRHEREMRRSRLVRRSRVALAWLAAAGLRSAPVQADEAAQPSPRAEAAIQLLESHDPYQRQLGLLRLEALREPAAVPAIQRTLADREPEVRAYGLRALGAIQGAKAVPALLDAARDREPRMRRAALLALEPLRDADPAVVPALLRALRDRKPEVRMTAIDIVSRIPSAEAREAVLLRARRERDPDVRRVIELALGRLGS